MSFVPTVFAATTKTAQQLANATEESSGGFIVELASGLAFLLGRIPFWIAAFVIFGISIFIAKLAKKWVESRLAEQIDEENQAVQILAGRVSFVVTLSIGATVALKIAGIDLTQIVAAIALGVGFALRDTIQNFIAGIMVLVNRHFTIGDFISVGGKTGKVMEIQTRATILKATDGTKVIVPNSEIFSNSVVSFTSNPMRRIVVPLYVAYGTDLDYAMEAAIKVLKNHTDVLKRPPPSIIIKDYGDSSIDLAARFWVMTKGWVKVRSEIIKLMDRAFSEAGIVVPYNVVHLETSQDIAEEEKETQKKKKEISNGSVTNGAVQNGDVSLVPPPPATLTLQPETVATTAPEVPTPAATYEDMAQIDDMSSDNG